MKTYLITGNDTGIGKTKVTATFLKNFISKGFSNIQVIKPVESGVSSPIEGDVESILFELGNPTEVTGHTFFTFKKPLSPHTAAEAEGKQVKIADITAAINELPEADIRIIEGAGGIATPINFGGEEWLDLAKELQVDGLIIVIENRLASINQARIMERYVKDCGLNCYFWLNEVRMQHSEVLESNYDFIKTMNTPILAKQDFEADEPVYSDVDFVS